MRHVTHTIPHSGGTSIARLKPSPYDSVLCTTGTSVPPATTTAPSPGCELAKKVHEDEQTKAGGWEQMTKVGGREVTRPSAMSITPHSGGTLSPLPSMRQTKTAVLCTRHERAPATTTAP